MSHEIEIRTAAGNYETKSFVFPGGELQVQIPNLPPELDGCITVVARLQSADDMICLLLTAEILSRQPIISGLRRLVIPYFPYARQDRVMAPNEAFSLKPIASLISSMGFDRILTCDPHSDVTSALVDRIEVVSQLDILMVHQGLRPILTSPFISIVAPDAGAAKKAFSIAHRFGLPLITASKLRDVSTGQITRTEIHNPGAVSGRDVLIVDDICDGGRTFIELAKVLKEAGAEKVFLYVTHGIFSQGFGVFRGLIDGVFTTDSFSTPLPEEPPVQGDCAMMGNLGRSCAR